MNKAAVIGLIVLLAGAVPTLMLFASHIAYSIFSEERILGTTSIAQRHAYRLMLAPAYIGVAFYFIGGALGLADMWGCGSSKESRLVVHIASVVASVVFLVSGGAALMANILTLPTLPTFTTPQEGRISSTIIVDFVGIVLMEACYIIFLCIWFAATKDNKCDEPQKRGEKE